MAMAKIIIVNSGSVSYRYSLFENDKEEISYYFEKKGEEFNLHEMFGTRVSRTSKITVEDFENSFDFAINKFLANHLIQTESDIKAVAFRVVAPGSYFVHDRIVDKKFLENLDDIREQTPLHIDKMRKAFDQVKDRLGKVKMVAISDSRFHQTMPEVAKIFGISKKIRNDFELERFGYHGISVSSVVKRTKEILGGNLPEKTIICHLGGGSSITALLNGETIDTSMGYSPLEGLTMSTRVGDIDAGALMAIQDYKDLSWSEIRDLLYYKSGLFGISGGDDDIRILIERSKKGDDDATLALDYFIYKIKKYIGSYIAILGGLDLLVLTGTISERSAFIREKFLADLGHLNIDFDSKLNNIEIENYAFLNRPNAQIPILVVKTDEAKEMAIRTIELL